MYEEFFGLGGSPFRLNPDPRFFFGSRSHNKAMAYLHYGLRQAEGFIVITGEIGAGKSMLIGHLLDQLDRTNVVAANLLTSSLEPAALLSHVLSAFRIEPANAGKSAELEAFEDFLFDQMNRGRRVLLIVDEAQNLPVRTIEELRMLSNMDYDGTPLFQIFLVGQPEFRAQLAKADMEQFRQRVIATYHLEPLAADETKDYIQHRLSVVGWSGDPAISDEAYAAIHDAAGGVPRKINSLCNRLFLFLALEKQHALGADTVAAVVKDLSKESFGGEEAEGAADTGAEKAKRKQPKPKIENEKPQIVEAARVEEKRAAGARRGTVVVPFGAARKVGTGLAAVPPGDKGEGSRTMPDATKQSMPSDTAGMSVLDRLRARRAVDETEPVVAPIPAPATLKEVAQAIAAASALGEGEARAASAEFDSDEDPLPEVVDADKGWKVAVVKSINETREELRAAHSGVARFRKELEANSRRRAEARLKIAANLARAETLLSEIRDAWR